MGKSTLPQSWNCDCSDGIKANLMGALEFIQTTDDTGVIVSKQRLTQMRSRRQSIRVDQFGVPEKQQAEEAAGAY